MLRPYSAMVRALAEELALKRELNGAEVDEVIEAAIAAKSIQNERQRRDDWRDVTRRAKEFDINQVLAGHH